MESEIGGNQQINWITVFFATKFPPRATTTKKLNKNTQQQQQNNILN